MPSGTAELVLNDQVGSEVVYLIMSQAEISIADPRLAHALAAAGPTGGSLDCEHGLGEAAVRLPGSNVVAKQSMPDSPTIVRGTKLRKKPLRSQAGAIDATSPPPPTAAGPRAGAPPEPDFERSPGEIVWYQVDDAMEVVAADADGIVVVRYTFQHVARSSRS